MKEESIGLLGGTGDEGQGLALRLGRAGYRIRLGSRSLERAREVAEQLNQQLPSQPITGEDNHDVARNSSILFLCVPFLHAASLLEELEEHLGEDCVLVDLTVPLRFEKGPRLIDLPEGSGSEHLRRRLPARVSMVSTLKTLPAHLLLDLDSRLDCDEYVCWDSKAAMRRVLKLMEAIEGIRWIDAGPLRFSRALEAMTFLVIGINRRYKIKEGRFRLLGLDSRDLSG